jgi:predicted transcriptional regulator
MALSEDSSLLKLLISLREMLFFIVLTEENSFHHHAMISDFMLDKYFVCSHVLYRFRLIIQTKGKATTI